MTEDETERRSADPARWTHSAVAEPAAATTLRRRVRRWAETIGVEEDVVDAIELSAYEALANVVEHAYITAAAPGIMTLTAVHDAATVTITVTDAGTWKPPVATAHRRHGLALAAAVSDHIDIGHPGLGTVVTMTWSLPTPVGNHSTPIRPEASRPRDR